MRGALRLLLPLVALVALALPGAAAAAYKPPARTLYYEGPSGRYLMGGEWLFRLDPRNKGLGSGWNRSTRRAGWSAVTVPNVWNLGDDSPASMIGGVGWYRKDFSLPDTGQALAWAVRFESVNYRSRVWLNGKPVGSNHGAYIPFEFRLNGIKRRGTNRLVIRVDSRRRLTDFPPSGLATNGAPTGGWWNYSGLQREVYLKRLDTVDWKSVQVTPLLACASCTATVRVRATLRNVGSGAQSVRLTGNFGSRRLNLGTRRISGNGVSSFSTRGYELKVEGRKKKKDMAGHVLLWRMKMPTLVFVIDKSLLKTGTNVIAVEIHQNSAGVCILGFFPGSSVIVHRHEDPNVTFQYMQNDTDVVLVSHEVLMLNNNNEIYNIELSMSSITLILTGRR